MSVDNDLVQRVVAGDGEAAARLTATVRRLVHGLARRRFGIDADAAEDLLQASLARLWDDDCRALRAWRGKGRLTTYITVIVANLWSREQAKASRREDARRAACTDTMPEPTTPADRLADKERRRAVERALGALRPRDRLLLTLRFVDENSCFFCCLQISVAI